MTVTAGAGANGQKFYPDDPINRIVDAGDASGVQEREIDLEYDTLENLFSWPGDQTPNVRAQNLNTIDDVPNSTWFTNRLGTVSVTVDELVKGPGSGTGPAPGGWTVISAKNDGVMPGFTVAIPQGRSGSSSSIRPAIRPWRLARRCSAPGSSGGWAITCRRRTSRTAARAADDRRPDPVDRPFDAAAYFLTSS